MKSFSLEGGIYKTRIEILGVEVHVPGKGGVILDFDMPGLCVAYRVSSDA